MKPYYSSPHGIQKVSFPKPGTAYLYGLYVNPNHRGKGEGQNMMAQLVTDAQTSKTTLTLHTRPELVPFFTKFGFNEQGTDKFGIYMVREPALAEASEDDDEIDVKYLAGEQEQQTRKEWAEQNLWFDQDKRLWWIPGTSYSFAKKGTVAEANHVAMLSMFPWLEEAGSELDYGLYISNENIEWMPLWNPFRRYCGKAKRSEVIDEDSMNEVFWAGVQQVWKERIAGEAFDALASMFHMQFKTPGWEKDLIRFLESERGFRWFNKRADDVEEYWNEESLPPSINVEPVAQSIRFEDLVQQLYPEKNQPELNLGQEASPAQGEMFEAEEEDDISDFMRQMKIADPGQVKAFMDEHFQYDEANEMWEMGGFCNFGGSLMDRANCAYFEQKYPGVVETVHGGLGSETVGIRQASFEKMDADMLDSIYHDLGAMGQGPIDEKSYYELESELRQEAWDSWVKREFSLSLRRMFPQYEEVIVNKQDDPKFRALFEDARDQAGEEWNEEPNTGGDQTVRILSTAEHVTENMIQEWLLDRIGEDLSESERAEYSVVMAPAPPELTDAIIRFGEMFITNDKLYVGDKDPEDFGREKDVHVTVKFGLHEPEPSEALLKIVEETQPFEISIGTVSLFENELFDVVKFDVDSEALRALNARISELKNSDSHPEYHPHMTVAYVMKGTCHDLVGKPLFAENEPGAVRFLVKSLTFRGASREKITLFLGKPNIPE